MCAENVWGSVLSVHHVGSGSWTKSSSLVSSTLYLLKVLQDLNHNNTLSFPSRETQHLGARTSKRNLFSSENIGNNDQNLLFANLETLTKGFQIIWRHVFKEKRVVGCHWKLMAVAFELNLISTVGSEKHRFTLIIVETRKLVTDGRNRHGFGVFQNSRLSGGIIVSVTLWNLFVKLHS